MLPPVLRRVVVSSTASAQLLVYRFIVLNLPSFTSGSWKRQIFLSEPSVEVSREAEDGWAFTSSRQNFL